MGNKERDWELWGTFSVGDHLRRHAFVADLLLYDRLVIPVPPESDDHEYKRWVDIGWKPKRQKRLLDLIEKDYKDHILKVPWTDFHRTSWEDRYNQAIGNQQAGIEHALARSEFAKATAGDVSIALKARESFDWKGHKKRGGRPEEVDELAHFTTRDLLVDWSNMKNDTEIFMGLPPVQVDAVVAYNSYLAFNKDFKLASYQTKPEKHDNLLSIFGWEFLVPFNPKLSHEDLLKQAIEIANMEETKAHRELFHKWRRYKLISGADKQAIKDEMEGTIREYKSRIRRSKIKTFSKHAFAVFTFGIEATAALTMNPILAVLGTFTAFGSYASGEMVKKEIPEN